MLEANIPDLLELDLSDDECEGLELAMTPEFVVPLARIAEAVENKKIDWEEVEKVEGLPLPST
ncbi:MAG: hypothetical protein E6J43_12975 [Chloroflexi bacterium]|nr:MAG: hypothetical protein E6J43_12975 [Chloroflexota bacterium]